MEWAALPRRVAPKRRQVGHRLPAPSPAGRVAMVRSTDPRHRVRPRRKCAESRLTTGRTRLLLTTRKWDPISGNLVLT